MQGAEARVRRSKERGSSLVEYALILLPMFGFLMLTLDIAWLIFAWACLNEGVREGVRFAITSKTDAAVRQRVAQYSFGFVKDSSVNGPVSVHYYSPTNPAQELFNAGSNCSGNIVKVVVSGIPVIPFAPVLRSKSPLALAARSADIVEPNQNCATR